MQETAALGRGSLRASFAAVTICSLLSGEAALAAPRSDPGALEGGGAPAQSFPVVGGAPAPPGKWPDAAGVELYGDVGCTGVLVAPTVVLTAAHCLDRVAAVLLDAPDTRSTGTRIPVVREVAYPAWWISYDIGMLILERPASVEPRVIATGCVRDQYLQDGAQVAIVGYGATDVNGMELTTRLMEGLTTITNHDCSPAERGCNSEVSPNGELGAGGEGVDSCNGDSGGPLYLVTDRGSFLVGITSRAYSDARTPCSEGGIYTRPDAVIDWIETTADVTLPEPACNAAPAPAANAMEVHAGETAVAQVTVTDADEGDTHVFAVVAEPEHGDAEISDTGTLTYTADSDYVGEDSLTVEATDSGTPPLDGQVTVLITVLEPVPGSGCGCRVDQHRQERAETWALAALVGAAWLGAPPALGKRLIRG